MATVASVMMQLSGRAASWMDGNLVVQGYRPSGEESGALRWGLRFPTALCLALVVIGLALQSAVLILALVPIRGLVTATNFFIPSTLLGAWWRRRRVDPAAA